MASDLSDARDLLVAIAIYIRLQLKETPIFQEIKAKGQMTRPPWKEAFLSPNIKYVGMATLVLIGQGVVWYSGRAFLAEYFPGRIHVSVGAVSHRQRLGRRIGAVHHHGSFRGHWQHRQRADLPDRCSGGVLRALRLLDAGDPQDQHLAADRS